MYRSDLAKLQNWKASALPLYAVETIWDYAAG